jgi:hypothetical protein
MGGTFIFQESLQLDKKMLHSRQADTIFDALGSGGESPTESMLKGMTVESVEEKGLSKYLGKGASGEGDGYDDAAGAGATCTNQC